MTRVDKTYADAVREAITVKGVDVLLDAKLLNNCIRDIAGKSWSTECRIAERNLDQDMLEAFHEAAHKGVVEVQAVTRSVAERLRYDCGLLPAIAESISCGIGAAVSSYARDEEKYAEGRRLMASGDYVGALAVFTDLGAYKNAVEMVSECARLFKLDQAYEKAKKQFSDAVEEEQFLKLAQVFDIFDGYKASAKWMRKCVSSADKAREAEQAYREAKSMLLDDTLSAEQYHNGAQLFKSIEWYKDSAQGYEACERLASEATAYEKAAAAIESSSSTDDLRESVRILKSLGTYRDAAKLLKEAEAKLEKQRNYRLAVQAENKATKSDQYEIAGKLFKAIGDYGDAAERAEKNAAYARKLREKELKRLANSYRKAVDELNQAQSLEDYKQALKQLERHAGYRDVDELIAKCQFQIEELKRERDYDYAKKALDVSFSPNGFSEVETRFRKLGNFRDAAQYAEEARRRSEEAAKEERYVLAVASMNSVSSVSGYESESEYKSVAKEFDELGDYKDSRQKAKQCRQKAAACRLRAEWEEAVQRYQRAVEQMETSSTEAGYKEAGEAFRRLGAFKDAGAMASACDELAEACRKAAEKKRIEEEYSNAVEEYSELEKVAPTKESYLDLARRFEELGNYKDSKKRGEECRAAAEIARKDQALADANCLLKRANDYGITSIETWEIRAAIWSLQHIGGWKDADTLTFQCQDLLSRKLSQKTNASNSQDRSDAVGNPLMQVILFIVVIMIVIVALFAVFSAGYY